MSFKNLLLLGLLIATGPIGAMKRQAEQELSNPVASKKVKISLLTALKDNNGKLFKQLVTEGADVNEICARGPLFFVILEAIDAYKQEAFKVALKAIAIECFSQGNNQALERIKEYDSTIKLLNDCVALIINQKSFDVKVCDSAGCSPLMLLAYRTNVLDTQNGDYNKIVSSQNKDFIDILKPTDEHSILLGLLAAGADVNECDEKEDNSVIIWMISQAGAKLRSDKNSLLMIDTLICHGANVNKLNKAGYAPLDYCLNDITMTALLVSHDAHVNHSLSDFVSNPYVQNIIKNKESIGLFKKDFARDALSIILQENKQCSSVQLLKNRQTGGMRLQSVKNVHTKAIENKFADLSVENIIDAMRPQDVISFFGDR